MIATSVILKGLMIGFAIAAPVGPVGVICIRRSLTQGGWYGLASGLGAATADAIYGCIAAFGVAWLTNLLVGYQLWFQLIGGLILVWMGWQTWRSRPADLSAQVQRKGLGAAYASVLVITLTNPMTILSFAGIISGMGIAVQSQGSGMALLLVGGVFLGSLLWWILLSFTASRFREKIQQSSMVWINRLSGVIIFGFGLWALYSGLLNVLIEK